MSTMCTNLIFTVVGGGVLAMMVLITIWVARVNYHANNMENI